MDDSREKDIEGLEDETQELAYSEENAQQEELANQEHDEIYDVNEAVKNSWIEDDYVAKNLEEAKHEAQPRTNYNQVPQSPQGYPPYGYAPQGYAPHGYAPQGYPPHGYAPQGYPPHGYAPQGYPPHGYAPQGYPPHGYAPQQGHPPHTYYQGGERTVYPPIKKKTKLSIRIFAWSMLVLFVGSFGGYLGMTIYYAMTNTPSYNFAGLEDYFGDGIEGFDSFEDYEGNPLQPTDPSTLPEVVPAPEGEENDTVEATPYEDGIVINPEPEGEELDAQAVYEKVLPSINLVKAEIYYDDGSVEESFGTGMFITDDGYILTNSHVVFDTKTVTVTVVDNDGDEYAAVVLGYDRVMDIAVLKVEGSGFTPVEFGDTSDLDLGQWVVAIGNPGGESFSKSITRGIVSGLDRVLESENDMKYIQTDAAISPGNSGGPLVNMYGQVVGITTAKITAEDYEGIGLAIPVSESKTIIDELLSQGFVGGRVRLGITGANADVIDYTLPAGVLIIEIEEDSVFVGTDIMVDDVITKIDDEEIYDLSDLSSALLAYSVGDLVTITVDRNGEEITAQIALIADNGETQR